MGCFLFAQLISEIVPSRVVSKHRPGRSPGAAADEVGGARWAGATCVSDPYAISRVLPLPSFRSSRASSAVPPALTGTGACSRRAEGAAAEVRAWRHTAVSGVALVLALCLAAVVAWYGLARDPSPAPLLVANGARSQAPSVRAH